MAALLKEAMLDVLRLALKREVEAFNYYYKASMKMSVPETESLLLQLAEEERKHRIFVQREMHKIQEMLDSEGEKSSIIAQKKVRYSIPVIPDLRRLSHPNGIDIAGTVLPSELMAGDFLDSVRIDEAGAHKMGVLLFDVMGHGLDALQLKAKSEHAFGLLKESWLENGILRQEKPRKVMEMLNKAVLDHCQKSCKFISALYVLLDPEGPDFTYASAGHDPPVLIRKGKYIEFMETDLLLGAASDYVYGEYTFPIQSGDRLILYTDGVTEAEDQNRTQYGRERLIQAALSQNTHSASELLQAIWDDLKRHVGPCMLLDDMTLAVITLPRKK